MERTVFEQYVVKSPRGNWTNHHYTEDGLIGERVSSATATHLIRTVTEVLEINND